MRLRRLLALGSVITPTGAVLAGCFSDDTSKPPPLDASLPDLYVPPPAEASLPDTTPPDTSLPDTSLPDTSTPDGAPPEAGPPDAADAATQPATDLTTAAIDFGPAECGSTPSTKMLTFHNTGGSTLTYNASLASGVAFSLSGTSQGSVAPGQAGTLSIAAKPIPASSTPGTAIADTLTVKTNAPGAASIAIPVTVTPRGGFIKITPSQAAFGQQPLNVQAPDIAIQVTNVGTEAVSVSIPAPQDPEFAVTYTGAPSSVSLAPGASLQNASVLFKAASSGLKSDSVTLQVTGTLCQAAAPALPMSGTGTTLPIAIAPGAIDFLTTPCGSTAASGTVTLTNSSSMAVTYSATFGKGAASAYAFAGGSGSGTVPANGTATITVQPSAVPRDPASLAPNALSDSLSVTTGPGGGGASANIALTQAASGVVLAVAMPTTNFGTVIANAPQSLGFNVTNSGNLPANVSVVTSGDPEFSASLPGAAAVPADGSPHAGTVSMAAQPPYGPATATLTVSTTSNLCQGAQPAPIGLSAIAAGPIAQYATTPLSFAPRCGQPATAGVALTVTNGGTSPLVISGVAATAGYTVTGKPAGAIAPGKSDSITVSANAPSGEAGGSTRTGTLSFTTNEYGSPLNQVSLTATIMGANLAFTDSTGNAIKSEPIVCCSGSPACTVPSVPPYPWWYCPYDGLAYYINNSGNEPATLGAANLSESTYCATTCQAFSVSALTSSTIAPGASVSAVPTGPDYTNKPPTCSATGPTTHDETVSYPVTSGDVCIPLGMFTVTLEGSTHC
jgi:hypothetical protein